MFALIATLRFTTQTHAFGSSRMFAFYLVSTRFWPYYKPEKLIKPTKMYLCQKEYELE